MTLIEKKCNPGSEALSFVDPENALRAKEILAKCPVALDSEIFAQSSIRPEDYYWQKLFEQNLAWLYQESQSGAKFVAGIKPIAFYSDFFDGSFARIEPLVISAEQADLKSLVEEASSFITAIIESAKTKGYTHLTAAVDSFDGVTPIALANNSFFLANTVIFYLLEISKAKEYKTHKAIRLAEGTDEPAIRYMAGECFGNRLNNLNHFNCDPQFKASQVEEFFATWAAKCVQGSLADAVFVFEEDDKVAGFLAIELPSLSDKASGINLAKIPLNAVQPSSQGRGIYNALISHALNWLAEQGVEWVEIGTSLSSKVHTPWQKLGARFYRSFYQYHYHY